MAMKANDQPNKQSLKATFSQTSKTSDNMQENQNCTTFSSLADSLIQSQSSTVQETKLERISKMLKSSKSSDDGKARIATQNDTVFKKGSMNDEAKKKFKENPLKRVLKDISFNF